MNLPDALFGFLGIFIGALFTFLGLRRKAQSEDRAAAVAADRADVERAGFLISKSKELIDWYRGDYVTLRERITALEGLVKEKDATINHQQGEISTLKSQIVTLTEKVASLQDCVSGLQKPADAHEVA